MGYDRVSKNSLGAVSSVLLVGGDDCHYADRRQHGMSQHWQWRFTLFNDKAD
jgi:hypothetical protein